MWKCTISRKCKCTWKCTICRNYNIWYIFMYIYISDLWYVFIYIYTYVAFAFTRGQHIYRTVWKLLVYKLRPRVTQRGISQATTWSVQPHGQTTVPATGICSISEWGVQGLMDGVGMGCPSPLREGPWEPAVPQKKNYVFFVLKWHVLMLSDRLMNQRRKLLKDPVSSNSTRLCSCHIGCMVLSVNRNVSAATSVPKMCCFRDDKKWSLPVDLQGL